MEHITYAPGYDGIYPDEKLIAEAEAAAKEADVAVIFAGLPRNMETEGIDREHMCMPESHNALIAAVAKVQPNTVVVLYNGSPVEMPWADSVKGILEMYLPGEAVERLPWIFSTGMPIPRDVCRRLFRSGWRTIPLTCSTAEAEIKWSTGRCVCGLPLL